MTKPDAAAFLAAAKPPLVSGNTQWASAKAREVADLLRRASARAPRSQQVHLGPSEIGVACDRQIVGKLVREAPTNHVSDPWPSIVGTAVHAWLAEVFAADNPMRWLTERRVVPHPDHAGTADLYDAQDFAVLDHKVLGETTMAKVRSANGPPRKYVAQLALYGFGYLREGFRVDRVGVLAYPRTGSSLDGIYVWEHAMDASMAELLAEVFSDMKRRRGMAAEIEAGQLRLEHVPTTPSQDECFFCPFYRPSASVDGVGCDGKKTHLSAL